MCVCVFICRKEPSIVVGLLCGLNTISLASLRYLINVRKPHASQTVLTSPLFMSM